jgi:hypothetical protein
MDGTTVSLRMVVDRRLRRMTEVDSESDECGCVAMLFIACLLTSGICFLAGAAVRRGDWLFLIGLFAFIGAVLSVRS